LEEISFYLRQNKFKRLVVLVSPVFKSTLREVGFIFPHYQLKLEEKSSFLKGTYEKNITG
jgi:hypothetical protein